MPLIRRAPSHSRSRGRRVVSDATLSALRAGVDANVPVLLWGAPGTSKSAMLAALAASAGAHLEVQVAGRMDPTDLGLLFPFERGSGEEKTAWLRTVPPDWLVRLADALSGRGYHADGTKRTKPQPAWLFLDELTTATPAVLAGLLRLVQERAAGGLHLPELRVVAAANPPSQAAGAAMGLDAASADRWMHLRWDVEGDTWRRGMTRNWGSKKSVAQERIDARYVITGYLAKNTAAMGGVAPREGWGETWGRPDSTSPRSWDALSAVLASIVKLGYAKTVIKAATCPPGILAVRGLVGTTNQGQFHKWLDFDDLPDPEDILSGKEKLPTLKDRAAVALLAAVMAALKPHKDQTKRVVKALHLLTKLDEDVSIPVSTTLLSGLETLPVAVVNFIDRDPDAQKDMIILYDNTELVGAFAR